MSLPSIADRHLSPAPRCLPDAPKISLLSRPGSSPTPVGDTTDKIMVIFEIDRN
jgi:hypothetical protein